MTSVLKYRVAACALVAALSVTAGTAQAADLGGDCCADLEERIAELEATTARKGNRKVSLEISGQVNEAIMFWDDGFESNAYVVTNDNSRTRFRFKGEAKIDSDWKAGYLLELGVRTANSKRVTQDNDLGNDTTNDVGLDIRHSYWYVDSKKLGRVSVGTTGSALEGVTETNLAASKDVAKYSDVEDSGLGMALRLTNGNFTNGTTSVVSGTRQAMTWRRLIRDSGDQPGEGRRPSVVKYDTPELAGFKATAAWGEDDFWDVGLRYSGEFGGFKIAAGIAYGENKEVRPGNDVGQPSGGGVGFECLAQSASGIGPDSKGADCSQIGGSISVMHVESGLYANFAAGELTDDLIQYRLAGADDTSNFWAAEIGIEQKWLPLGKTTVFGQYYLNEGGSNARRSFDGTSFSAAKENILNSELEGFGFGVIQGIDAAAMHIYLTYRHYEADVTTLAGTGGTPVVPNTGPAGAKSFEDLDVVMAGALIKF